MGEVSREMEKANPSPAGRVRRDTQSRMGHAFRPRSMKPVHFGIRTYVERLFVGGVLYFDHGYRAGSFR
jgi:hypothetical protein